MGNCSENRIDLIESALVFSAIILVRLYQLFISRWLNRKCLFAPSCSQRAIMFFKEYGLRRGLAETRKQLKECCGTYSLRVNAVGDVELITHSGFLIPSCQINPQIKAKMFAFDFLIGLDSGLNHPNRNKERDTGRVFAPVLYQWQAEDEAQTEKESAANEAVLRAIDEDRLSNRKLFNEILEDSPS
ncbi:MAG: membrane protein insertion efficiency factor YidD [Gemmataceae bacterium]|nr:membrane protein insertion efficiency factor YidD [Gemmataceae bacterium]